jgi:hypothetical protein
MITKYIRRSLLIQLLMQVGFWTFLTSWYWHLFPMNIVSLIFAILNCFLFCFVVLKVKE